MQHRYGAACKAIKASIRTVCPRSVFTNLVLGQRRLCGITYNIVSLLIVVVAHWATSWAKVVERSHGPPPRHDGPRTAADKQKHGVDDGLETRNNDWCAYDGSSYTDGRRPSFTIGLSVNSVTCCGLRGDRCNPWGCKRQSEQCS